MDTQFLEAVFTDSLKHPNFFNGRILTATDLREERTATLQRSQYLGRAIGTGVVDGLVVTADSSQTALVISDGLAINPRGDALHLPTATTVKLVLTEPLGSPTSPFVPCDVSSAATLTGNVSTGFYLLAITGATRLSNSMAFNSGLTGDRPNCTNRYEEVGIQFKLVPLINDDFITPVAPSAPDSRSRLAHVCFGTNKLAQVMTEPNQGLTAYGLVDDLRQDNRLTNCDVPLAAFRFQSPTLQFVDRWAVRRPVVPAMLPLTYAGHPLTQFVSSRRLVEASVFLLQFQEHLKDLLKVGSITPSNVVAQEFFEYLPAAGYLPVQVTDTPSDRRFKISTFFGAALTDQLLEPALLRSIFHESFLAEPIRPGIDPVDLYQVAGSSTTEPYRIFVRRVPIVLPPPVVEEPEEPTEEPPPIITGDLYVTVLSTDGKIVAPEYIQSIQAIHQTTGQIYTATRHRTTPLRPSRQNSYQLKLRDATVRIQEKYRSVVPVERAIAGLDLIWKGKGDVLYFFNDLPEGRYTVQANPTQILLYGVTESVQVRGKNESYATVVLRKRNLKIPDKEFIPDDFFVPPRGVILDGYRVKPEWVKDYPNWETDLFGAGKVINPPPDVWVRREEPRLELALEELFDRAGVNDPRVVTAGAALYIRKDYNPTQPGATVAAFVQTQDGQRFPAVPLAVDNALDQPATVDRVDRTLIPEFDRATVEQLRAAGLDRLDAIASAPTKLVAGVLGQSLDFSNSLVTDAQTTLQADFRQGFMGYAGITKTQSDTLKQTFQGSKAALANASLETLATSLSLPANSKFVDRFRANVRNTLPTSVFSLAEAGISAVGQAALGGMQVNSTNDFLREGNSEAGRVRLKEALRVNDLVLNQYLETAALNYARGQLLTTPERSISTLENIPTDVQLTLANTGIVSARELANADPNQLATILNRPVSETREIVNAAANFRSNASLTLVTVAAEPTAGPVAAGTVANAGLTSLGTIAQAESTTLSNVGIRVDRVQAAKTLSNRLLSDRTLFRRFQ